MTVNSISTTTAASNAVGETTATRSNNVLVDRLTSAIQWSWNPGSPHVITYHLSGDRMSSEVRTLFRAAFDSIEAIVNLRFQESSSESTATFVETVTSTFPYYGLVAVHEMVGIGSTQSRGTYAAPLINLKVVLHEIGHGLGLFHAFADEFGPGLPGALDPATPGDYGLNSSEYTMMAYSGIPGATPMALDIAALQWMYGANTITNKGNNVYLLGGESGPLKCIWDTGGVDTIAYDGNRRAYVSLVAATLDESDTAGGVVSCAISSIGTIVGQAYTIANGVEIENARGGSGDDTLIGNQFSNLLEGGNGNDLLEAAGGADILHGGTGADTLAGGEGNDALYGEGGDDLMRGDAGSDRLWGGDGKDTLLGGDGADTLEGQAGADSLVGGDGTDIVVYLSMRAAFRVGVNGSADITITDRQGSIDTLSGIEYIQFSDQTVDTLSLIRRGSNSNDDLRATSANLGLLGGVGNDTLTSVSGGDTLVGQDGDDVLIGAAGSDLLIGGDGLDTAVFNLRRRDYTIAYQRDGRLKVSVAGSTDLLEGVELIRFSDQTLLASSIFLYGTSAADNINAPSVGSPVYAKDGDDLLRGSTGSDQLLGEAGDDTLFGSDQGSDLMDGGQNIDLADYSNLQQSAGINAVFNSATPSKAIVTKQRGMDSLLNIERILGSAGADTISAYAGEQTLDGGAGDDLISGAGRQLLIGGAGRDTLLGGANDQTFLLRDDYAAGGAGNDTFMMGIGSNTIFGGDELFDDGDDVLLYEDVGVRAMLALDIVKKTDADGYSAGMDWVHGIEQIGGSRFDDNFTGSMRNETFIYSGGNDVVDGGGGEDTLKFINWKWSEVSFARENGRQTAMTSSGKTAFFNIEKFSFADGTVIALSDLGN